MHYTIRPKGFFQAIGFLRLWLGAIAALFWLLLLCNGCGWDRAIPGLPMGSGRADLPVRPEQTAAEQQLRPTVPAVQTSGRSVLLGVGATTNAVTGEICQSDPYAKPPHNVVCFMPSTNAPEPVTNISALNIPWPPANLDVWLLYSANPRLPFSNWSRVLVISSNWNVNPRGVLPTPFYHFTDTTTDPQRYYALLYKSQ